jgi:hypothetical protein
MLLNRAKRGALSRAPFFTFSRLSLFYIFKGAYRFIFNYLII